MNNEMKLFLLKEVKILIVDDYVENLKVLGSYLLQKGIQVTPATKGSQAILLAQSKPFDLILLDIQMPEMDGYEVCKILKSDDRTKDIPVIFLSARNDTQDIVKGFNVGAVDYITKPFNSDEILSRIKNHLELKFAQDVINEQTQNLLNLMLLRINFSLLLLTI
jgi:PleD family two-component response regulator